MATSSGRSAAILAGTLMALMVLSALPVDPGGGVMDPVATPTPVTGVDLVVTEEHVTSGQEVWGDVIVQRGARLVVPKGAFLVATSISLAASRALEVTGGGIVLSTEEGALAPFLRGGCNNFNVTDGGVILIEGRPGNATVGADAGMDVELNVFATSGILVRDSTISLVAGRGLSPDAPLTQDDLGGGHCSGGDAKLVLEGRGPLSSVRIVDSLIEVHAGDGGDAPDGRHSSGATGGNGGGFTQGGDVSGQVGAGGDATAQLSAPWTSIEGCVIELRAGEGGRAGDAGPSAESASAGGGGGGYSGGWGAHQDETAAGPGGDVSGHAGAGGNAMCTFGGGDLDKADVTLTVDAGDGGRAGDGGDAVNSGGGGGGGYSSGGGGSTPLSAGAPGGRVSGDVGSGGEARVSYELAGDVSIDQSTISATGGDGGRAGKGGSCLFGPTVFGGAGGGGYSGGGGGALGYSDFKGDAGGTPGGRGGNVTDRVASGGGADIQLSSTGALLTLTTLEARGGSGGRAGSAGRSSIANLSIVPHSYMAGGGGGSYSAGGGGGNEVYYEDRGRGGEGGAVDGEVGDGGDARNWIATAAPSVLGGCVVEAVPGSGGLCWVSEAPGEVGGRATGRSTAEGRSTLHIPMSRGHLLAPENATGSPVIPEFNWSRLHPSTANGAVVSWVFEMSDSPAFNTPNTTLWKLYSPGIHPSDLPNLTTYWHVRAVYDRPSRTEGPWSEVFTFTLVNEPPVITAIPVVTIRLTEERTVDLSPYIFDPDDWDDELRLSSEDTAVKATTKLNLTIRYNSPQVEYDLYFTVRDDINFVDGRVHVIVYKQTHAPIVRQVGDHKPPVDLELDEGTERWYEVVVHDVDSYIFKYSLVDSWSGATMHVNGTLQVLARKDEVGVYGATIVVEDEGGLSDDLNISIRVRNVVDPPLPPIILSPANHTKVEEGETVTFRVQVLDPDIAFGEWPNVIIVSNRSGVIRSIRTNDTVDYTVGLPAGEHRITVIVSDGFYTSKAWIHLSVKGEPGSGPDPEAGEGDEISPASIAASIVLFALTFAGGRYHARWRRRRAEGG